LNFIILGLLTLIATPIARIVLGIVSFAMEKDKLYVIITVIVLFNLIFVHIFITSYNPYLIFLTSNI